MRIGVPKEIKVHEYRVGLTPASVREVVAHGHEVLVETGAAARHRASPTTTIAARRRRRSLATAAEVFADAELIVKVKEPQPAECAMLREGQTLFTYLHLAPDPEQTKALMALGRHGHRLRDRDERARRPAAAGAHERGRRPHGDPGRRALPGDGAGRPRHAARRRRRACAPAKVVVLGGGVVRRQRRAHEHRARGAGDRASTSTSSGSTRSTSSSAPRVNTIFSTRQAIEDYVLAADLVIGAVLVPGAAAPKLITEAARARR